MTVPSVRSLVLLSTLLSGGAAMAQDPSLPTTPQPGCVQRRAVPLVVLPDEPPARLVADAPVPSQLAEGRVVIAYCAENLLIRPVYGEAALGISPRVGHIHVTVDGGPMRWVDASGEPLIINKLPPGPHSVLLELVDPTHRTIDSQTVRFEVPVPPAAR